MNIEEIKEEVLKNIEEFVTNEVKSAAVEWLAKTAWPAVKEMVDGITSKLKTDSEKESGWNKIRDSIFLPSLINLGVYLIGKALEKMAATDAAPAIQEAASPENTEGATEHAAAEAEQQTPPEATTEQAAQ